MPHVSRRASGTCSTPAEIALNHDPPRVNKLRHANAQLSLKVTSVRTRAGRFAAFYINPASSIVTLRKAIPREEPRGKVKFLKTRDGVGFRFSMHTKSFWSENRQSRPETRPTREISLMTKLVNDSTR